MYPVPNFAGNDSHNNLMYAGAYKPPGGSNQYMNFPSLTGGNYGSYGTSGYSGYPASQSYNFPPGAVPPSTSPFPSPTGYTGYFGGNPTTNLTGGPGAVGAAAKLPGHESTVPTIDPLYTQALDSFLRSQLGAGISPFGLSSFLPSTGGFTGPGQVAAPLTPELQQLSQFLQTGQGGGAGAQTLEQLSQTGLPTDVGPAWQAMLASEQRNISENANQLKEQFAGFGAPASSDFGTAISDFYTQTTLDQNAQLTAAEQAAQEAATGRQAGASQFLTGLGSNLGTTLQGLDQQSIQNLMQEYFMTLPQFNPLNAEQFSFGTTFPPVYGKQGFAASFGPALGSALGTSLGTFGISNQSGTAGIGG